MVGEILQHHAFAKNIQFLNQQASSLSSQPQISHSASAVHLSFSAYAVHLWFGVQLPCFYLSVVLPNSQDMSAILATILWILLNKLQLDYEFCAVKPPGEVIMSMVFSYQ